MQINSFCRKKKEKMYLIKDLYDEHSQYLKIKLMAGKEGLAKELKHFEIQRPGIALAGNCKKFPSYRILLFGKSEIEYLQNLSSETRKKRVKAVVSEETPFVVVSKNIQPLKELRDICTNYKIPLFKTSMPTVVLLNKIFFLLHEKLTQSTIVHGTLMEVFGMGVLIQGESSVGKSEAALGLLAKGHRLIADDAVKIKKKSKELIGSGPELTRHMMEIRGIGIINVAHLYGAVCVRHDIPIDFVIKLEEWNEEHFYDRVGVEEKFCEFLGSKVPYHILPVKQGRDIVLLIETLSLNHRLKELGYNSAEEFNMKLLKTIRRNEETLREKEKRSKK